MSPEEQRQSEIRHQNYSKISRVGLPWILSLDSHPLPVNGLYSPAGEVLPGTVLSPKYDFLGENEITLSTPGDKISRYTVMLIHRDDILLLKAVLDTWEPYEGAGFGRSLFLLGETLQDKLITMTDARNRYAHIYSLVEDTSRSRKRGLKTGWTSYFAGKFGYRENEEICRKVEGRTYRTRIMLFKER